ncbi:MAG: hypothetical protein ACI9Y1_001282 [Lentisphaeria bacterium]|jgi:hypothetical protein
MLKLEGFDPAWNHVGSHNMATYTNLNLGNCTLRVEAANSEGVWNEQGKSSR